MNWKQFNLENFVPILFFIFGMIAGLIYPSHTKSNKQYPIEIRCYWESGSMQSYPIMEADSVRGDTIYKDGIFIVNKNIKNIEFR